MLDKTDHAFQSRGSRDWREEVYEDYHSWKEWDAGSAERDADIALREVRRAGGLPPSDLLEIGYGDGAFLNRARALGFRCSGIELDEGLCEKLRAEGIDARAGSLAQFDDGRFDIIVVFDVFEHMQIAELLETLKLAGQKLKPEGRLVARFPNMASPFGVINQFGDVTHCVGLSPKSYLQLARIAGLEPVLIVNALTGWRGLGPVKFAMKAAAIALRRCMELVLGFAYYGARVPLDPEVTVVCRKKKHRGA